MHTYIKSEPGLFTVGHHDPEGKWIPESDHDSKAAAAQRVRYLNGGELDSDKELTIAQMAALLIAHGKATTSEQAVMKAREILATVYMTEEE